jgi:hypothetical protein
MYSVTENTRWGGGGGGGWGEGEMNNACMYMCKGMFTITLFNIVISTQFFTW